MATTRSFKLEDLFKFNNINLDVLTETYNTSFYYTYLATWPEYFKVIEAPSGRLMSYVMGKSEGKRELWHGHVTAVTVAPEYRRLGLAKQLMQGLEDTSERVYNVSFLPTKREALSSPPHAHTLFLQAHFVDLFVRQSNSLAISMYRQFG